MPKRLKRIRLEAQRRHKGRTMMMTPPRLAASQHPPARFLPARYLLLFLLGAICLAGSVNCHADGSAADIHSVKFLGVDRTENGSPPPLAAANPAAVRASAKVEVRFSYDGSMGEAFLMAKAIAKNGAGSVFHVQTAITPGREQSRTLTVTVPPMEDNKTETLEVQIYTLSDPKSGGFRKSSQLVTKTFAMPIQWPESVKSEEIKALHQRSKSAKLLDSAIETIDRWCSSERWQRDSAKQSLDTLIADDPSNAQAYLELARIAMKSDCTASEDRPFPGLDEAHRLINVALKINPEHANSYVLLGYVLGIKKRTDEAIAAFTRAQKIGTSNKWLYYNWGLALQNANRIDEAIKKYQEGLDAPLPAEKTVQAVSNNRASRAIFSNLMRLLEERNELAAIDAAFEKSVAQTDPLCQMKSYAEFKLYKTGDFDGAIKWATQAQEKNCSAGVRPLLAAAYLAKWALDQAPLEPKERDKLLNRGQAFVANSQQTIVDLASSPHTEKALAKLASIGFGLNEKSANGLTPLALAVAQGNPNAVKALIAAGANPDLVLEEGWTPLMIAVASNHAAVVGILLEARVDVDRKNRDGQSAMSIARYGGNPDIIRLLSSKSRL